MEQDRQSGRENAHMMSNEFRQEAMRSLGRIEGKVEGIMLEQKQQKKQMEAVTSRVGRLEQYRAKVAGIAATIGAGVGYLISLLDFG